MATNRRKPSRKSESPDDDQLFAKETLYIDAVPDSDEVPLSQIDTFVITESDDKNRTHRVNFRIPPFMHMQIKYIMRAQRWPWLEDGDFIRWCVWLGIRSCTRMRPKSIPQHIIPTLDTLLDLCRETDVRIRVEHVLGQINTTISKLVDRGQYSEAKMFLAEARSRLDALPETSWTRQFRTDLTRSWSHLSSIRDKNN